MPRPPSADWPGVLAAARTLAEGAPEPLTFPALWQALLDREVLTGGSTQWSGFRHQLRAAQRRGEFPTLAKAKSGPEPGSGWSEDRRLCHEEYALMLREPARRREAATDYVASALARHGTVRLTPAVYAELARKGWGAAIVDHAVRRLVGQHGADVVREGWSVVVRETFERREAA